MNLALDASTTIAWALMNRSICRPDMRRMKVDHALVPTLWYSSCVMRSSSLNGVDKLQQQTALPAMLSGWRLLSITRRTRAAF